MIFSKDVAFKTAEYLLQIKAIKLNITNPFQWASGWKSPIYCDNRAILSYPKQRNFIVQGKLCQEEKETVWVNQKEDQSHQLQRAPWRDCLISLNLITECFMIW